MVVIPLLFAASSCAVRHVDFRPRENGGSESPSGKSAAGYELVADQVGGPSELRVWSDGAELLDPVSALHVGFEIENRFDAELRLDPDSVRVVALAFRDEDRPPIEALTGAVQVEGPQVVAEGGAGTFDFTYELPPGVLPGHIQSFAVEWQVVEPAVFEQRTGFRRVVPDYARGGPYWGPYPYYGYGGFYGAGFWPYGPYGYGGYRTVRCR